MTGSSENMIIVNYRVEAGVQVGSYMYNVHVGFIHWRSDATCTKGRLWGTWWQTNRSFPQLYHVATCMCFIAPWLYTSSELKRTEGMSRTACACPHQQKGPSYMYLPPPIIHVSHFPTNVTTKCMHPHVINQLIKLNGKGWHWKLTSVASSVTVYHSHNYMSQLSESRRLT